MTERCNRYLMEISGNLKWQTWQEYGRIRPWLSANGQVWVKRFTEVAMHNSGAACRQRAALFWPLPGRP